jgi:hypothetical protein
MKSALKALLLAAMLLASVSAIKAQVSIGITIAPPPPLRVAVVLPARPDPEFVWVEGYWYPLGRHYKWHEGYWTRPPYEGARWVAPHHDGQQFFVGYWEGDRGRVEHDHHSDRGHDRDFHDRDHDRDHDRHSDKEHNRDDR